MDPAVALAAIPPDALVPHIPELLTWLQDINWPIARPVAAALSRCGIALVEPVRSILLSDDDIWKTWILGFLRDVSPDVRLAPRSSV